MMRIRAASVTTGLVLLASAAAAHPGHGADGGSYSLLHYLSEPVHIAFAALLAVGVVGGLSALARSRRMRRPD